MKTPKLLALITALGAAALLAVTANAQTPAPAAASGSAAAAPTTYSLTLTGAHVCCGSCVKGVSAAVASLSGVKAVGSTSDGTIAITAPDKATAQKAVDALTGAGFFGTSSDAAIKVNADTGATATKVSSLAISNLHLCCAKCVTAVNDILKTVPGVTANTAAVKAATFTVTGDFSPKAVMDAFQKGGLTGKAGATVPEVAAAPKT